MVKLFAVDKRDIFVCQHIYKIYIAMSRWNIWKWNIYCNTRSHTGIENYITLMSVAVFRMLLLLFISMYAYKMLFDVLVRGLYYLFALFTQSREFIQAIYFVESWIEQLTNTVSNKCARRSGGNNEKFGTDRYFISREIKINFWNFQIFFDRKFFFKV